MIARTIGACRFNIYKFSEVLVLRGIEQVISKRNDFVVDALFYFEPVQRFKYRGEMFCFGFQLLRKQGSFAVTGDDIYIYIYIYIIYIYNIY